MPKFSVILAAAGKSSRFRDPNYKKPFALLNRKAVWLYSAELFLKRNDVKQVIIVISPEDKDEFLGKYGPNLAVLGVEVVLGGAERSDSVQNALAKVDSDSTHVVIHDAARPCLNADLIESVFQSSKTNSAVIPAVPVTSTLKLSKNGGAVDKTVDRSHLYEAQTPQVFERELLISMFANRGELKPTDESQLAEELGHPVAIVKGSVFNIKITSKQDLAFARACLESQPKPKFDAPIHPFADDNLFR
ncbi:MAG: 2-C-methyl-D-erythritol 4-phosphate cytidylyltransferase [Planctomycetaceae bacterium]|nr:2-C-methyl-D-erythritol 4-phosphate cytidylyltransferase [Planctomycetaceae bacterium]MCP4477608.1 2-C-methyl-D-erythritol 4-phosphate cytidylyltransferase [Planctomycetaceae bacterium]